MEMKNMQLFADNPTVNVTTDSGLSAENKTFYDRALIEEAQPNLIHGQFGQKRPIPRNGGKRIQFRRYASLPKALKPLTEGVTPEGRKLSATALEAEVNQYGDFVCLSDVLDLTAIDNNVLEATKAVGRQAGLTLDTITRNVLQSGTNVYYCPKAAANGQTTPVTDRSGLDKTCVLTVDVVKKVAAMLKAANAPRIAGDYVCILHPYVAYDIMSDPHWEDMHKYCSPENMYEGEIGRIAGVRFVETSEAAVYKGAGDECPDGLAVFGCLFLAEASRPLSSSWAPPVPPILWISAAPWAGRPCRRRRSLWSPIWSGWSAAPPSPPRRRPTKAEPEGRPWPPPQKERKDWSMEEKRVTIRLPLTREQREDVFVGINGKTWLIKRGEEVSVPWIVAKVLARKEKCLAMAMEYEAQAALPLEKLNGEAGR